MKVTIARQQEGEEECATLLVHRETEDMKSLRTYLEEERFRGIFLECRKDKEACRIHSRDILYIEAVDEVQLLHTALGVFETRMRLYELEKCLPDTFVRISRSVILALDKAAFYKPQLNGLMQVQLVNGDRVYISRQYLKKVRSRVLGEG